MRKGRQATGNADARSEGGENVNEIRLIRTMRTSCFGQRLCLVRQKSMTKDWRFAEWHLNSKV